MARIRSIKPEFPQSESMGRVSRDARLLFILLWPICDDHGRTRAASRMLASLLFPYDEDAKDLVPGWLDELEREGCIRRYEVDGSTYLEVRKWLIHQKIDKPSKPQYPLPPETLAKPREDSSLEGKGGEGRGEEGSGEGTPAAHTPRKRTTKPEGETIDAWLTALDGDAVPAGDPIFEWAAKQAIPGDWLGFAWAAFEDRYAGKDKTYLDWRAAFRDHVKRGWLDIWRADARTGGFVLTTVGEQWKREVSA